MLKSILTGKIEFFDFKSEVIKLRSEINTLKETVRILSHRIDNVSRKVG